MNNIYRLSGYPNGLSECHLSVILVTLIKRRSEQYDCNVLFVKSTPRNSLFNVIVVKNIAAIRLAQLRGEAMQVAASTDDMGMMTVFYKPSTKISEVLTRAQNYAVAEGIEQPICEVSNYLFPHCKVIAGHTKVTKCSVLSQNSFVLGLCM